MLLDLFYRILLHFIILNMFMSFFSERFSQIVSSNFSFIDWINSIMLFIIFHQVAKRGERTEIE